MKISFNSGAMAQGNDGLKHYYRCVSMCVCAWVKWRSAVRLMFETIIITLKIVQLLFLLIY